MSPKFNDDEQLDSTVDAEYEDAQEADEAVTDDEYSESGEESSDSDEDEEADEEESDSDESADSDDEPADDLAEDSSQVRDASVKPFRSITRNISLVTAFCLVMLLAAGLFVWKCFFDTSIIGSWELAFSIADHDYSYILSFHDDKTVDYSYGGITYTGRYTVYSTDDAHTQVYLGLSYFGSDICPRRMDFEISGNAFSGRTLRLTDRSGMIFPYDNLESQNTSAVELKTSVADYFVEDGIRYYVHSFKQRGDFDPYGVGFTAEDYTTDPDLLGCWLYSDADYGIYYTFNFYEDGSYDWLSSEFIIRGNYSAADGECTYYAYASDKSSQDMHFEYTIKDDVLSMNTGGQVITMKRTSDKYDYIQTDN